MAIDKGTSLSVYGMKVLQGLTAQQCLAIALAICPPLAELLDAIEADNRHPPERIRQAFGRVRAIRYAAAAPDEPGSSEP